MRRFGIIALVLLFAIGASWLYVQYGDERWFGFATNEVSKRDYSKILQERFDKLNAEFKPIQLMRVTVVWFVSESIFQDVFDNPALVPIMQYFFRKSTEGEEERSVWFG